MPQSTSDIRYAYDLAANSYAKKFLTELQFKPLDRQLLNRFATSIGKESHVVDIGCGPGHTTDHLASLGLTPTGVDLSPGMISVARSQFPELEFAIADFFSLPYEEHSFSGCLAFYCIVNLQPNQLRQAFAEMHRVLKPNGLLLLSFHVGSEPVYVDDFLNSGTTLEFFPFPVNVVTKALESACFIDLETHERSPYETEYPSQRCYVFARKANGE